MKEEEDVAALNAVTLIQFLDAVDCLIKQALVLWLHLFVGIR